MAVNHSAHRGRGRMPSHGAFGDTANPSETITCPVCRRMIGQKRDAAHQNAITLRSAMERSFYQRECDRLTRVLCHGEAMG